MYQIFCNLRKWRDNREFSYVSMLMRRKHPDALRFRLKVRC
ncbi:hypothetical protein SOVF_065820 [Spinacia oleracea]|nr:hypothetical protein SOVF_065820 [Spinacia oleracea]